MIIVRVEKDRVVTHAVALAGLVVDLEYKAVECVSVLVDRDDLSETQRRAIEARPPMFGHSHREPYKTVGPLGIVREHGGRHRCVGVEDCGQYEGDADRRAQAV